MVMPVPLSASGYFSARCLAQLRPCRPCLRESHPGFSLPMATMPMEVRRSRNVELVPLADGNVHIAVPKLLPEQLEVRGDHANHGVRFAIER